MPPQVFLDGPLEYCDISHVVNSGARQTHNRGFKQGGVKNRSMAQRTQRRPRLVRSSDRPDAGETAPRRSLVNQVDLAYERIETLLVNCELRPGRFLTMQDLQDLVHFGRTPTHHAISRLAADTLVNVRPRHGVQIAPIDLTRERGLLPLRRDTERFVIRLASDRSGPSQRNQMLHLKRLLREQRDSMTIAKFNSVDRRADQLIMTAAGVPFLEHTLRPLRTVCRSTRWPHHTQTARGQNPHRASDCPASVFDRIP